MLPLYVQNPTGFMLGMAFYPNRHHWHRAGAAGSILANQGNAVLIGGIGECYFSVAIARACIRDGGLRGQATTEPVVHFCTAAWSGPLGSDSLRRQI